jgi:ABC-type transporter Mla MlaB component
MALFSKPPAKKPTPRPSAKPYAGATPGATGKPPPSAREVAAHHSVGKSGERRPVEPAGDITVTGASLIEWAPPGQPSFEVAQANPGLCAVLEDAALRYASGHAEQARTLLEQGVLNDHDAKLSPLAWLALFDLQQRAGDRTGFDRYALKYVVQFERSAPAWEAAEKPQGTRAAGGYVGLPGKLTTTISGQLEGLRRAVEKQLAEVRLDFGAVTAFDDDGARLLAHVLGEARRAKFPLQMLRTDKFRPLLDAAVKKGLDGGEGAWLLSLEMLQWAHAHEAFEDRAVEFAVTFELSPPSWEPPPVHEAPAEVGGAAVSSHDAALDGELLVWSGVMAGSIVPQIGRLAEFAQARAVVPIDMSQVERVDFVCAGAMLNAINRVEMQRKAVQIVGASPIIRALLLLIGISPRHFVKKSD